MFSSSRHLPCLAALIAAGLAAASAQARDAGPLPAASPARLAIVETDHEFAIRTVPGGAPRPKPGPATGRLALGRNLKLDRSLFDAVAQSRPEDSDAPRR